ncbi:tail fiber domain-containing protein [Bacillus sp. CH_203]|uniref:tail fiber domain-containing protein n=1 Tax=Bacillus sp. CH_203 TaxID=2978216 RepID=UPI0030FB39C2|nr:tail fiber domain-containing protein [Bacillus cereus]
MARVIRYLEDGVWKYASVKDVGDLEKLQTVSKADIVSAINELVANGNAMGIDLGGRVDGLEGQANELVQITGNVQEVLGQVQGELNDKVEKMYLDEQVNKLVSKEAYDANYQKIEGELLEKVDVNKYNEEYQLVTGKLNDKADLSAFEDVKGRVSTTEQEITNVKGELISKVGKTEYDGAVGLNRWIARKYDINIGSNGATPSFDHIKGKQPSAIIDYDDNVKLQPFVGDYYIGHYFTNIYMKNAKTVTVNVTNDDGAVIYMNGAKMYEGGTRTTVLPVALTFRAGWNTVEVLHYEHSGATEHVTLGVKLSTQVDKMTSVIGVGDKNETRLTQAETEIKQTSEAIKLKAEGSEVTQLGNRVQTNEGSIEVMKNEIKSLVRSEDFNKYTGRLEVAESTIIQHSDQINQKVGITQHNALNDIVTEQQTSINQLTDEIDLKATKSEYDGLNGRVGNAETQIKLNTEAINLRAKQTELDKTNGRLQTAESQLNVQAGEIASKVTQEDINKSIDDLSFEVRNLILNSGFARGFESWNNTSFTILPAEADKPNSKIVKVGRTGASANNIINLISNKANVQNGDSVSFSVDFKVTSFSAYDFKTPFIVEFYDDAGVRVQFKDVSLSNMGISTMPDGKWIRLTYTEKANSASITKVALRIGLFRNGEVFYREPQMQIGTKATGYMLAPEDSLGAETRLANAESTIVQHATAIDLKANANDVYKKTEADGKVSTAVTQAKGEIKIETDKISQNVTNLTQTVTTQGTTISNHETSISQMKGSIDLKAEKKDVYTKTESDGKVNTAVTNAKAEIKLTTDGITQTVTNVKGDVSGLKDTVTAQGTQIKQTSDEVAINVVKKGNVKASINASTEGIKIGGQHVDITGQVTFQSLDPTMQGKVNAGADAKNQIDGMQLGGQNIVSKKQITPINVASSSYDESTNTWTLTANSGAGGAWGAGVRITEKTSVVPVGSWFTGSFEIFSPIDATWNVDVNNFPVTGTSTSNDNDDTALRKTSSKALKANTWTKCWFMWKNKDNSASDLYDQSNIGLVNSSGAPVTFKIRNVKGELGNVVTAYSPSQVDIDELISNVDTKAEASKKAIADMSNDNKATSLEKQQLKKEWATITAEKPQYEALANTYGITTEKTNYVNAYNALNTAITPIIANISVTSDINGATFRNTFDDYYDKKAQLIKKINELAKKRAEDAETNSKNYTNVIASNESSYINKNYNFADWTGSLPNGYAGLVGASPTKIASENGNGNTLKFTTTAGQSGYINTNAMNKPFYEYAYIESTFKLESGSINGSGILFRYWKADGKTIYWDNVIKFKDIIPSPVLNKWYTVSKIVKVPVTTDFGGYGIFPMASWATIDSTMPACVLQFDSVITRPATEQEISSYESSIAIKDMSNDNKLTPIEKQQLKKEWATISAEKPQYEALSTTYGVTTEKTNYVNSYNALNTFITPFLTNTTTTSDINGTTFRNTFDDYYDKKAQLIKKVNELSRSIGTGADAKAQDAKNSIADMSSDSKITAVEKVQLKKEWAVMVAEKPQYEASASSFGIVGERNNYVSAYNTLNTALNGTGGILTNMTTTSSVNGATFRAQFDDYYDKKAQLVRKINDVSKEFTQGMNGRILYNDPMFRDGLNSISIYNNTSGGNVTLNRIAKPADAPTISTHILELKSLALPISPAYGGFTFQTMSRANAIFLTKIVAKIPVGTKITWASNSTGDNGKQSWLTSQSGTGKWEEYICRVQCGATGNFSTTNFFAIEGGTLPLTWHVAYATVFDATDYDYSIKDMSNDNKLTPVEKQQLKKEWATISAEKPHYETLANNFSISTEKTNYVNSYNALNTLLTPLIANITTTSDVNGGTFRNTFDDYYDKKAQLNRKINESAKALADGAQVAINAGKPTWDRASNINSNGTWNTTKLSGQILDAQIASAVNWNGAKSLLDSWKSGTTLINGGMIATNTIFSQQIAIGDFTNLSQINEEKNPNGYPTVLLSNKRYFKIGNSAYAPMNVITNTYVEFKVNDEYYIAFNGYRDSGITSLNAVFRYYYTDNTWENAGSVSILPTTADTRIAKNLKITAPPNDTKTLKAVNLFFEKDNGTTNGYYYIRDIEVRKRYTGELVVDGSIKAQQLDVASLFAHTAFINNLKSQNVSASNIVGGVIKGIRYESINASNPSIKLILEGNTVKSYGALSGGKQNYAELKEGGFRVFEVAESGSPFGDREANILPARLHVQHGGRSGAFEPNELRFWAGGQLAKVNIDVVGNDASGYGLRLEANGGLYVKNTTDINQPAIQFESGESIYLDGWGNFRGGKYSTQWATWSIKDANDRLRILIPMGKGTSAGNEYHSHSGGHKFYHDTYLGFSAYTKASGTELLMQFLGKANFKYWAGGNYFECKNQADNGFVPIYASAFNIGSSEVWKTDIEKYEKSALDVIANTNVMTYKYKSDVEESENPHTHVGLIAEYAPKEVQSKDGRAIDGYAMSSIAWKAIQELSEQVRQLKEQLNNR